HRQLEDALDVLASALGNGAAVSGQLAARLAHSAAHAATLVDIARVLAGELSADAGADILFWAEAAQGSIESWRRDVAQTDEQARSLKRRLADIELTARAMAEAMQFGFLLDSERRLLSVGYRTAEGALDPSCYDLLASEARLASFVAIAKSDVPARHWFRLGRAVTPVGHGAALISWSGSMFEYLMPSLVMRAPAGSLLEQTSRLIVRRQISYGAELGIPWGISESAYNVRDLELTYQYSNFGVPGLGLKRGLSENAVIAPYATALAAMVDPRRAARDVSVAHPRAEEVTTAARIVQFPEVRRLLTPHTATPQAHLLSNGRYSVMLTDAGSGYSRWRALDVTRWREDSTRDDSGSYFFLRDIESGAVWSASYQPSGTEPDSYQVTFAEDRAEFVRRDAMVAAT